MIPFLTGLQAIHANNKTHTIRKAILTEETLASIPMLLYQGKKDGEVYTAYRYMKPGVWTITINDIQYLFILHQSVVAGDEFIVKNVNNVFAISNLHKYPIVLYQVDTNWEIDDDGFVTLGNCIGTSLDAVAIKAKSFISSLDSLSWDNNAVIKAIPKVRYVNKDTNGNIKEKDVFLYGAIASVDNVEDTYYLDCNMQSVLYDWKIGKMFLTGNEAFYLDEDYQDNRFIKIYLDFPEMRANSKLLCSHLKVGESNSEPCIFTTEDNQRIYFKLLKSQFSNVDDFKQALASLYDKGKDSVFKIFYELNTQRIRRPLIDTYKLETTTGTNQVKIANPFNDSNLATIYFYQKLYV